LSRISIACCASLVLPHDLVSQLDYFELGYLLLILGGVCFDAQQLLLQALFCLGTLKARTLFGKRDHSRFFAVGDSKYR
jgi:hypothetical protein